MVRSLWALVPCLVILKLYWSQVQVQVSAQAVVIDQHQNQPQDPTTLTKSASTSSSSGSNTASHAAPWGAQTLPNPNADPIACGRQGVPSSYICDPDHYIHKDKADIIEGIIKMIVEGTSPFTQVSCNGHAVGAQIAVAVVKSIKGKSIGGVTNQDAQDFARHLHDNWGVGDKECNYGAVVFLSIEDRQLYISTGSGMKQMVTDDHLDLIIGRMKPYLKAGDVAPAIEVCVRDMGLILSGQEPFDSSASKASDAFDIIIPFAMFGAFLGVMFYSQKHAKKRQRDYDECVRKLSQVEKDRALALANQYQQRSCPICLGDFDESSSVSTGSTNTTATDSNGKTEASNSAKDAVKQDIASKASTTSVPQDAENATLPKAGEEAAPFLGRTNSVTSNTNAGTNGNISPTAARTESRSSSEESEIELLACGHRYHKSCLREWISSSTKLDCPVCRTPLGGPDAGGRTSGAFPTPTNRPTRPSSGASSSTYDGSATNDQDSCGSSTMGSNVQNNFNQRRGLYDPLVERELRFRLFQLHRLYPSYITPTTYEQWNRSFHTEPFTQDSRFRSSNPAMQEAVRKHGSSGSRVSFGGGSSRGGGGRGGSW